MASVLLGLSEENKQEIKTQIEYYLSDENLEHDSFLHEKISQDPNGYVELSAFLNYNEIKKKEWSRNDLRKGVELSTIIEVDDYGEKVRRKGNKKLPELKLLNQKREMEEEKEDENVKKEEEKKDEEKESDSNMHIEYQNREKDDKIPIVLKINFKEKNTISWKSIDEFKKLNQDLNVEYGRLKDSEAYLVILIPKEQKYDELKYVDKFTIEGYEFTVQKCEGEELDKFWKEHGSHYDLYTKKKDKLNKLKENKAQRQKEYLASEVGRRDSDGICRTSGIRIKLGDKEYSENDIDLIRKDANNILRKYGNNDKVEGEDKAFILDLLKYHHKYEEITRNIDFITVDINERFKFLKSFYIVDKNNNRIKFSSKSCVQNIAKKFNME